jgi:hypothetical protein
LLDLQTNLGSFDGGPVAPTKQFTTDVFLTCLLHPGIVVYLRYNNCYTNLILHPGAAPTAQGAPNNSTSRLFFIKLSYVLRY